MSTSDNPVLDTAGRLFADLYGTPLMAERPRADAFAGLWPRLDEAGLPLAAVAEEHGGVGLPFAEAIALVALAGAHAVPAPLAETIVAGGLWSRAAGAAPPAGPLSIAAGPAMLKSFELRRDGAGYRLEARLARVPWGASVERILVAGAFEGRPVLCMVAPPRTGNERATNLAHEPRDTMSFSNYPLAADGVAVPDRGQPDLFAAAALMRAAQIAGALATTVERTVTYANERVQFGKPIGKFQAVQQQIADAAGEAVAVRAAVDLAAAQTGDPARFQLAAAAAKARAGEAAGKVAAIAHQVHAAIGFTNEHALQLTTKRLWSWRDEFGDEIHWQRDLGRRLLSDPAALWPTLAALTPVEGKEA
jgi:alkylation response protein AidB-like acyl-CoA dehydrogenase